MQDPNDNHDSLLQLGAGIVSYHYISADKLDLKKIIII